eukprot:6170107-Prorocentrum_lima.AAC.1
MDDQPACANNWRRSPEGLEQRYKQGPIPQRKDCPTCQQTSGPIVRHHLRSDRAETFGTLH